MAEQERITGKLASSPADMVNADMETSECLNIDSDKDRRMRNELLNGSAEFSGVTKSHSGNETTVEEVSDKQCDTKFSSGKKKRKKRKWKNPQENNVTDQVLPVDNSTQTATLEISNVTNHVPSVDTTQTATPEISSNVGPTVDVNLSAGLPVPQPEKKKGRRRKKKPKAPDSNDIPHEHQEGASSMKNTPIETDLVQPKVNKRSKADSELINYDAEASLTREISKGKGKTEMNNPVEINCSPDMQEGDGMPNPSIIDIKCLKNVDASSVLEVAEEPITLPDSADTSSRSENDMHAEDGAVSVEERSLKTYKRKKEVSKSLRKRIKVSNSKENDLDTVEECSGSSGLVVKNRVGENSSVCSDKALPSCCPENMSEKEVLAGHGTSLQVVECISVEKASSSCLDCEPKLEETKKTIEMETSRQAMNEVNVLKDQPVVENLEENFQLAQRSKIKVADNVEGNACSVENNNLDHRKVCKEKASDDSGSGSSLKHIEQKALEIESKREGSNSSIQLGAAKEGVSPVVVKKDDPQRLLQHSPVRALTSHSTRKLLILDLNGLLVDIVEYVSDGYVADTRIGQKALFKRAFCNDFLQFCFDRFNVGVWSSRNKRNVDSVLNFLMANTKHKLLFCWDQSHCTATGHRTITNKEKPIWLKELKKLWEKSDPNLPWEKGEYNESNTVLLDDSPYKALLNPPNTAVFPYSYEYKDRNDNLLGPRGDLRLYLKRLASAENVQKFIEQNPFGQRPITEKNLFWSFYLKIITEISQPERGTSSSSTRQ